MAKNPTYEELKQRVKDLEKVVVERKRVEEALRESEERYRALFDRSLDCIYLNDFEGNFIDANPAALNLLGYKKEEIPSVNFATLLSPDQITNALEGLEEVKKIGFGTLREFRLKRKDGKITDVEIISTLIYRDGKPYAIQGIARDITIRKQAEEALRESEEKYRAMMEAMDEAVYICSQEFRVEYMNPAMVKRTGWDAVGELCHKVINELDEKCPWCVHNKVQQGERLETEIVSPKDGRSYNVSHSPIFHEDGSISKMTIYRDITEQRKAEGIVRRSEEKFSKLFKLNPIWTAIGTSPSARKQRRNLKKAIRSYKRQ